MGIDDWAERKGQRYGTIIVELQRGCPIDLLEDRAAETVATWLQAHPDVTIVARDRAEAYASGVRQGVPEATQVADRFHLCTHVASALQEVFHGHHREIAQLNHLAHNEPSTQDDDASTGPTEPPVAKTKAQQQITHNRAKRVAEYEQAHALRQQGWTMQASSTPMGRPPRPCPHVRQGGGVPRFSIFTKPPCASAGRPGVAVPWSCITRCKRRGVQGSTGSWRPMAAAFVRLKDGSPDVEDRDHPRQSWRLTSR
jgi:hypothetical protein